MSRELLIMVSSITILTLAICLICATWYAFKMKKYAHVMERRLHETRGTITFDFTPDADETVSVAFDDVRACMGLPFVVMDVETKV